MQQKYLDQFYMLYDDFHITKLPLLPQEVQLNCAFFSRDMSPEIQSVFFMQVVIKAYGNIFLMVL